MMTKITIRLPDALVQRAKIRAVRQRTQLQKIIAAALEAWLKHPDRDQGGETR
jgi:predicted transcriptional regulator